VTGADFTLHRSPFEKAVIGKDPNKSFSDTLFKLLSLVSDTLRLQVILKHKRNPNIIVHFRFQSSHPEARQNSSHTLQILKVYFIIIMKCSKGYTVG